MSQEQDVLYHLTNIGALTPLEALNRYGSFRLGAIIFDLRAQGYNITTTMITNGRKRYASYSLEKKAAIHPVSSKERGKPLEASLPVKRWASVQGELDFS